MPTYGRNMTGKTFSNFQLNFAQLNFASPTSLHQLRIGFIFQRKSTENRQIAPAASANQEIFSIGKFPAKLDQISLLYFPTIFSEDTLRLIAFLFYQHFRAINVTPITSHQ